MQGSKMFAPQTIFRITYQSPQVVSWEMSMFLLLATSHYVGKQGTAGSMGSIRWLHESTGSTTPKTEHTFKKRRSQHSMCPPGFMQHKNTLHGQTSNVRDKNGPKKKQPQIWLQHNANLVATPTQHCAGRSPGNSESHAHGWIGAP